MRDQQLVGFELSISGRDDGTIEAVYVQLLNEPVARTRELQQDTLIADYTADGRLVGFEVLAPVKISELTALIHERKRSEALDRFVRSSVPAEMVCA